MSGIPGVVKANVTSISGNGTVATLQLDKSIEVAVGDSIFVIGAIPLTYNGWKTVTYVTVAANGTSTIKFACTETSGLLAGDVVAVKSSYTTSTSYTLSASGDGNYATLVLTAPLEVSIGDSITVSGMTPTGYNGDWQVVTYSASAPYSVTFKCVTKAAQTVQGTVRAHSHIYSPGDWGNVGAGLGRLSTLNRGNVESALKTQVQSSSGWGSASGVLFGNGALDSTLPFPVAFLKAIIESFTKSIFGVQAPTVTDVLDAIEAWFGGFNFDWVINILKKMFPALDWEEIESFDLSESAQWLEQQIAEVLSFSEFNEMLIALKNNPEEFIDSLGNVSVDGANSFSNFLTELWKALTGQDTTESKDVGAVVDAAGNVYDDASAALSLGKEIVSSGSNIVKNPGFESILYQQLGSMYTTAAKRSGMFSLQLVGTGAFTASYSLLSSDDANPANVAVTAGDVYYAEVFVKAKSTNSQTSGGVGAIRMHFQPYDRSNAALDDAFIAVTPSAALKNGPEPGGWTKMSGYVEMPAGAKWLVIKLQLLPGVNFGETYYFDDVTIREVTLSKDAQDKAQKALVDPVESSRLPVIPVANIGDTNPNLLTGGSFDDAATLDTTGNFSWESEGRTKAGSAKVVADGTAKTLLSNIISVVGGQDLDISCYLKWSGVTASSGSAFKLSVVNYNEDVTGTTVDIATKSSPDASSSWTLLSGSYTVPSTGVDSIRIRLKVVETVTAGTILWDDVSAAKTGILSGGLVQGADNNTILDNVQNTWNSFVAGFTNIGSVLADVTGLDFSQTVADTSGAIAANALAITKLQTTATYNANSGIQEFVNFSDQTDDSSSLGAKWSQLYTGSGTGTLGIKSGRAAWAYVNNASRACVARYNVKKTLTDYQRIGVAYASAPGSDIFGNQAYNYIYGRFNSGTTSSTQSYVYAKLGKAYCELGCVVNGSLRVLDSKTSFSFKANSVYWLECGEVGGLNQLRLIDNSGNAIISYTDINNYSQVGSGYRWAGLGGSAFANGLGHFEPGSMLAFSVADNAPQPIVGSGFRRYRDSTSQVGITSGTNLISGSFFDTPEISTAEYEYTDSTNSVKVLKAGWYIVSLAVKLSDFLAYPFNNIALAPVLYKNGNVYSFGADSFGAGGGGNYRIAHTWIVYLNENDTVQPGYSANLDPVQDLVGSDNGAETYWQVSLLNWSLT